MFGSSNDKRSSSISISENISSSSIHIDQDQEEQSSIQKEVKSVSLEKSDVLISQTGTSSFDRIETFLDEEDNQALISIALSAQHWNSSYLNVPTRKMIKQSPIEDKEVYLREGALVAKKKTTI
jgi:hypothetical protein